MLDKTYHSFVSSYILPYIKVGQESCRVKITHADGSQGCRLLLGWSVSVVPQLLREHIYTLT